MATKTLNAKEQKVIEHFAKIGLKQVNATQVSFGAASDLYNVKDPLVFKVGDTNNLLVFGDIRKAMSFEQMKSWIESQMSKNKGDVPSNLENEIDGDLPDNKQAAEINGEDNSESDVEEINTTDDRIKEDEVQLIMDQVKISREEAINALKNANFDVFTALVELSKQNK